MHTFWCTMPPSPPQFVSALLNGPIAKTVKEKLFPEVWYVVEQWFAGVKEKRVLEIGYGVGRVSRALALLGWQVTVADPAEAACSYLGEQFKKKKVEVEVVQSLLDSLPFANDSFPAIVAINALEISSSSDSFAREVHRLLMPGGRAVIASFRKFSPWANGPVISGVRQGFNHLPPQFQSTEQFIATIKDSGLKLHDILDRCAFLPVGGKVPLGFKSMMIALVEKPLTSSNE